MAQILSWVALGLSGAALGHALFRAGFRQRWPAGLKLSLIAAGAVVLLGALATLPVQKPWSPGQTLAPGLLLGGLAVILAALSALGGATGSAASSPLIASSGAVAAATIGIGALLVLYPGRLLDSLMGYALGAAAAGILVAGSLRLSLGASGPPAGTTTDEVLQESAVAQASLRAAEAAELAALAAVALAATTFLSVFHRSPTGAREWQPLPAVLTAALSVLLGAAGAVGAGGLVSGLIVFLPLLLMSALIGFKLNGTPWFLWTVLIGSGVFGLVAWLERTDGLKDVDQTVNGTRTTGAPGLRADLGILSSFLVLGGMVLAFRGLHGFGMGLLVLAGLAVFAATVPMPSALSRAAQGTDPERTAAADPRLGRVWERPVAVGSLSFGLLLLLYRVFAESSEYRKSVEPDFLYYYVALVAGALLPQFLAGSVDAWMQSAAPAPEGRPFSALLRSGLAGVGAAVAPLAAWLLLGERAQAAFLVGLAVGAGFLLSARVPLRNLVGAADVVPDGGAERSLARLLPLGMALSAIQLTGLLEPLSLRSRMERIEMLAVVGVVAAVWILGMALRERRKA